MTETKTIEKIRANYLEKENTKFDELKALNKKVKRPAETFAYVFGSISSLVLGFGMSLAMKVIGNSMALGVGVGVLGILLVSINYPIYKAILNRRKQKYSKQIIELSNELLNK
ncbi:MAG: dihydropteridine reductase [Clostridia bacterium]|nr:dihydropteridine reductase [Clostridia bacterium]